MDPHRAETGVTPAEAGPSTLVTVRFFAAAAEAAGTPERTVRIGRPHPTVADLRRHLADEHGPALARVLAVSSLMVGGVVGDEGAPLSGPDGGPVLADVLPPFAGG